MEDKMICPHYNVGYCKFKEKCSKVHPKDDCNVEDCKRKGCDKRHRRICKYLTDCMRLNKNNDCEFKHAEKDTSTEKKLAEAHSTINKYRDDVEALRADIQNLKGDIEKKTSELDKLSTKITKGYKIVKEKDNEISKMEATFKKSLQDKNDEIAKLKKAVAKLTEENKNISAKGTLKRSVEVNCTKCKFTTTSNTTLKTHIEIEHCTCNICKEAELTSSPRRFMTCPKCKLVLYCGTTMIAHSKAQHGKGQN
jgi:predicted RNase H-like nuclease (RuvC/YqgF family)